MRSKSVKLVAAALGSGALAGGVTALAGVSAPEALNAAWTNPPLPAGQPAHVRETLLATGHFRAAIKETTAEGDDTADEKNERAPRAVAVLSVGGEVRVVLISVNGDVVSAATGDTIDGWRVAAASAADAKVSLERDGETRTFDVIDRAGQ